MSIHCRCALGILVTTVGVMAVSPCPADEARAPSRQGILLLITKPFLPPDFDQATFDRLWQLWEPALREKAGAASPAERRKMAYERYGLLPRSSMPGAASGTDDRPLQYVVDGQGNWVMSCLACHQGQLEGRAIPGLPNTQFELASLTDDVRNTKMKLDKPLTRMDKGSLFIPLGSSRGTTNAVMFGVVLMHYRDRDLNLHFDRPRPRMVHHDLDAPAWWHFKKKRQLYYDGFVPKNHRALMQFLLVPQNGPEKFREWEEDFRSIAAYLESLESPPYPFGVDQPLAAQGRTVFNRKCASCHGRYGGEETYPGKIVSIDTVGTDRVRLDALTADHRRGYANSWFGEYGRHGVNAEPAGYVAPPLDGIWATAPYLHNGSIPTLWHLFHADQRPSVWKRVDDSLDQARQGLHIEALTEVPKTARSLHQRRQYFDTRKRGKSAAGHLFPDRLDEREKRAVLEYLKTL